MTKFFIAFKLSFRDLVNSIVLVIGLDRKEDMQNMIQSFFGLYDAPYPFGTTAPYPIKLSIFVAT